MAARLEPARARRGRQIDHERALDDLAPTPVLEQRDRRSRRAAGRDQIVDQEHPLARRDRVDVDLDPVGAVLELVVVTDQVCGSLPGLRIGTKPTPSSCASAAPKMKPRASMPTTLSTLPV